MVIDCIYTPRILGEGSRVSSTLQPAFGEELEDIGSDGNELFRRGRLRRASSFNPNSACARGSFLTFRICFAHLSLLLASRLECALLHSMRAIVSSLASLSYVALLNSHHRRCCPKVNYSNDPPAERGPRRM